MPRTSFPTVTKPKGTKMSGIHSRSPYLRKTHTQTQPSALYLHIHTTAPSLPVRTSVQDRRVLLRAVVTRRQHDASVRSRSVGHRDRVFVRSRPVRQRQRAQDQHGQKHYKLVKHLLPCKQPHKPIITLKKTESSSSSLERKKRHTARQCRNNERSCT